MERARQELSERFGLERWTVFPGAEVCAGCRFLDGRVFFSFEGPQPPEHTNCRCGRLPVKTNELRGVALIRLVLEARANGREAEFLTDEAARRRLEERDELVARGRQFR
jgi:hypothetical protein